MPQMVAESNNALHPIKYVTKPQKIEIHANNFQTSISFTSFLSYLFMFIFLPIQVFLIFCVRSNLIRQETKLFIVLYFLFLKKGKTARKTAEEKNGRCASDFVTNKHNSSWRHAFILACYKNSCS